MKPAEEGNNPRLTQGQQNIYLNGNRVVLPQRTGHLAPSRGPSSGKLPTENFRPDPWQRDYNFSKNKNKTK